MTKKKQFELTKSLPYDFLIVALITVLGLVLRLYHLQFYMENGGLDAMWYIHAAVKYLDGQWLAPSATFKGPLLTLLLSFSLQVFGSAYIATKLPSLFAGSILPIATFLLGSELFNKKIGYLSALIIAVNPILIFYDGLVYREILFSLTWTMFIYFALRGFKGNRSSSIIGGVFFALSSLTIELGIFAGIGLILFFLFRKVKKSKRVRKAAYKNLDTFFLGAFLTFVPFLVKNYLTYKDPFRQWYHLGVLSEFLPFSTSALMWMYLGLMGLSLPYIFVVRTVRINRRFKRRFDKSLLSKIRQHSNIIRISLTTFPVVIVAFMSVSEFYKGPGIVTRSLLGLVKLLQVLAFPEALGFLLIFSIVGIFFAMRFSSDVVLVLSAFVFSAVGLTWGLTTHYLTVAGLEFGEILPYYPWGPLDNAFRYVSSYIPLLAIFASYVIFFLAEKSTHKLVCLTQKKARRTPTLKTTLVLVFLLAVLFQFFYADAFLRVNAQRDFYSLQEKYESVVNWLSYRGSPVIYSFNPLLKEVYGRDKVVLLTDESLMEIAQRATNENITYIVSDVFGAYSDAQLALFFGGIYDSPSFINLNRFSLAKSFNGWPNVQVFEISEVTSNQTALVVQHENWGQEWVSFLSENYLVDSVNDEEDLTSHLSGDYKLIVLTEIKRTLTTNELDILRQKVADGMTLIMNGLSPAYMDLTANGDWLGATSFVEAPKNAKWSIEFTESATNISSGIKPNRNYALYTSSPYSSPTGLTEIKDDVVIYATREDGATAIYAKPYVEGVVIFSGVRPSYATAAQHYSIYIGFVQTLLEKANDKTLFP